MATQTTEYAAVVTDRTETYLDAVEDCLLLVPQALSAYDDGSFPETTTALVKQESVCDEHRRQLRHAIGRAQPNFTDVYLRAADLAELFSLVDEVPNAAEAFVRDLDAMSPTLDDETLTAYADVATLAVSATQLLAQGISAYVEALVTTGPTPDVSDTVDRIAALESRCDDHRNRVISRAFERRPTDEALTVRALTQSLDAVPDATEDAADHLLFCGTIRREVEVRLSRR